MINFFKVYIWIAIPLLLFFNSNQEQNTYKTISHEVVINHPGEEKPVIAILDEIQNKEGFPLEYTMDVYSVICLEEVCKVIPVKIYWNNIGIYQKYELVKGETLEKYEADLFEPKDYIKLQSILSDSDSPFKDVYINEILTVPNEHGDVSVDAISGATALELDENDTVSGAALTCYTLWHWANGEVVTIIKDQTGKSVSNEHLKEFISNKNETYFNIALSALEQRSIFQNTFVEIILKRVLKDDLFLKESIDYLENTPSKTYLKALSQLFFNGSKKHKLLAIRSLNNSITEIPKSYLDAFSQDFIQLDSFQEVSTLFDLMQNKNPNSSIVINNVLPLLNSDFLIARRTYWFLNHQNLTSKQQKKLQKFQKKNKERL